VSKSREYTRATRVEELVRREVSDILRNEVKDPRVGAVTITRVKVAEDLKNATIFFGVLDRTSEAPAVEEALNRSAGFVHHHLVRRVTQKVVPRLCFRFDKNLDYSFRISSLLHQIEIPPDPSAEAPAKVEDGEPLDKLGTSPAEPAEGRFPKKDDFPPGRDHS